MGKILFKNYRRVIKKIIGYPNRREKTLHENGF